LKLSKSIVTLFFTIFPILVYPQFSKPEIKLVDNEKYIYPVNPGQPGSLAGTMGELRSTHFHSGIDIRTNNQIGYPVLASKSGYISRVSVSPSGYGNIIYITHPDGNTTLYAHLNNFRGAIAKYVLDEQYKRKTFSVDFSFTEEQFPVRQGDTIALSGNTGSSGGPHLHFDIRDRNNFALDPLKVASFPEVPDKLPPAAEKIALRTLDINSRINDQFGRFEFHALAKSPSQYTIASPIMASGVIGLELIAKDRLAPNSPFYGGVNFIEVEVDSQSVFRQDIEKINIAQTREIYTMMDFRTMRFKGTRFYKLFIDDGNNLDFYRHSPGDGRIVIDPKKESHVRITLRDSYNNKSTVSFRIMPVPVIKEVSSLQPMKDAIDFEYNENALIISTKPCADSVSTLTMYANGKAIPLEQGYFNSNRSVYLIDLRKYLPDSVVSCSGSVVTNLKELIPPDTRYTFYSDEIDVTFPEGSLYDTLYLSTNYSNPVKGREYFTISDRYTPLNKSIQVVLKPREVYNRSPKLGVYRVIGKAYSYVGGDWSDNEVSFYTREFGDFTIQEDNEPPSIRAIKVDRSSARFKIRDDLSGVASFDAFLNGEWLLMHYDAKTATIWAEKYDKTKSLTGDFELVVTDRAGNKNSFRKKIL
jgi:hypothetical protein